ncbi:MAG: DUF1614 domain-containing protein [Gammaproteobacteria bacterium]|nr:DUF1614 domain-containing protein [Gammaproteobacteria bacterium]
MRSPFSPLQLLLFIFLIAFLVVFVQLGVLTIAVEKLGLSPSSALLLLAASLFGSAINLPLFQMDARPPPPGQIDWRFRTLLRPPLAFTGKTVVAVNLGGCLIPLTFSAYLMRLHPLGWGEVLAAVAAVAAISHWISRPIPGLGIGMPIFVAPLAAAAVALLVDPQQSAPLAYICGTLGVLVGADLLRIKDIRAMGVPIAAIGGAGTFDGIFMTGIVAVLLA